MTKCIDMPADRFGNLLACVPAELHILEAAAQGFFGGGTPEEAELDAEIRRFSEKWSGGG